MDYVKPSQRLLIRSALGLIVMLLGCHAARAELKCENESGASVVHIGVNTPALVVTPSMPIGTTVYRGTIDLTARCSTTKVTGGAENVWFKRFDISKVLGNGLSLYVTYKGDRGKTAKVIDTKIEVTNNNGSWGLSSSTWQAIPIQIEVEIVKEQQASSTIVVAPNLSRLFTLDSRVMGTPATYFIQGASTISYKPQTCDIQGPASFSVPLGNVAANGKNGFGMRQGSTSARQDFSLNMSCDVAVSGTFKVMLQLDGTPADGLASEGVLAISAGQASASGVGVQVLHGDTQAPVSFGSPWEIGSFPVSDANLKVPFSARYYQTQNTVKAGQANSTMTYTISYL